jgi:NhaP-type Na+/H+ or K+/H+ antiporter
MDFKEHIETAWKNTLKFIGPVLILTVVQIVVSVFSLGIMAPVTMAGYMQSLLRVLREGREPEVKDLFSEMRLFLPLALFSLVVMVALIIGFTMLVLPGILMTGCLVFGAIYMVPLMTDKKLGIMDALKESWEMATRDPWTDQIILTLLYLIIVSVGGSVIVAVFFTQPLATFLVLSVYEERLQKKISLATPVVPPPPPPAE